MGDRLPVVVDGAWLAVEEQATRMVDSSPTVRVTARRASTPVPRRPLI